MHTRQHKACSNFSAAHPNRQGRYHVLCLTTEFIAAHALTDKHKQHRHRCTQQSVVKTQLCLACKGLNTRTLRTAVRFQRWFQLKSLPHKAAPSTWDSCRMTSRQNHAKLQCHCCACRCTYPTSIQHADPLCMQDSCCIAATTSYSHTHRLSNFTQLPSPTLRSCTDSCLSQQLPCCCRRCMQLAAAPAQ